MAQEKNYCVIMAGGIGSRFWPMSKSAFPKQFHDILGTGKSLLQMTFDRMCNIAPARNILIVTNKQYKDLVLEQLPEIQEDQVLCEPFMRNTAPCIEYANHHIASKCKDANIVVAPSDHLIVNEAEFVDTLQLAIERAEENDRLLTLGIKPSRPDTGYGYIQFEDSDEGINPKIKRVRTFTEKPNKELAEQFIESGDFYWNSGIFIWSLNSIQKAFQEHLPDMSSTFSQENAAFGTPDENAAVERIYAVCENISIDYGIMEKAKNVDVVLSDFGWSDLGTWGSLAQQIEQDDLKNAIVSEQVLCYQSEGNIIHSPKDKLVVLQGIDDCIVVDTGDVLMICKKDDEQRIKNIVTDLKSRKSPHV